MVLEVIGLKKSFRNNKVLQDVSFTLERGQITAIIGHSGAGKTTLLRCINALETCDGGSIAIDEEYLCKEENSKIVYAASRSMKQIRTKLGLVFQNLNLFPHKSVLENIMESPVNVFDIPRKEAEKKAYELLDLLGVEDRAQFYPYQLSGGQKQRVAIARACALNPSIMCFDEPTAALDPELKDSIASIIEKLASKGMAVLVISHDMNFVKRIADNIIFMEAGRILQNGRMEEVLNNPINEQVRRFLYTK